jgi:hypothetical protein
MAALNTFDFYSISATSTRRSDFTKAGIPADQIRGEVVWQSYGRKRYPRTIYRATLGFVDAVQPPGSNATAPEKADMIAAEWRAKGLNTRISYHCSD